MTNREITFIVRLRNEARQALAGLAGDIRRAAQAAQTANTQTRQTGRSINEMANQAATAARQANATAGGLDRVAASTRSATNASRERARALETEAEREARLRDMVNRSVDAYEAREAAVQQRIADAANRPPRTVPRMGSVGAGVVDAAAIEAGARRAKEAVADLERTGVSRMGRFKNAMMSAFDGTRDAAYHWAGQVQGAFSSLGTRNVAKVGVEVEKTGAKVARAAHKFSLGSGAIRELVVIAREGARGDFSRMAGSVSLLAQYTGMLGTVLPVAIVGFTGLFAAHKAFNTEVEKDSLKEYAKTLGLTQKEMKKLGNETVGAKGKLEEFDAMQVTWGDTIKGLWDTLIDQPQSTVDAWETFKGWVGNFMGYIGEGVKQLIAVLYAVTIGSIKALMVMFKEIPGAVADVFAQAFNWAVEKFNEFIQKFADGVNWVIDHTNSLLKDMGFETQFDHVTARTFDKMENRWSGANERMGKDMKDAFVGVYDEALKGMDDFGKRWGKNADKEARDRLKNMATAIQNNRTDPRGHHGKSEAEKQAEREAKFWRDLMADVNAAEQDNAVLKDSVEQAKKLADIRKVDLSVILKSKDYQTIIGLEMAKHTKELTHQLKLQNDASESEYQAKLKTLGMTERQLAVEEAIRKAKEAGHKEGIDDPNNPDYQKYLDQVDRAGKEAGKTWDVNGGVQSIQSLVSTYAGYSEELSANLSLQRQLQDIEDMRKTDTAAYEATLRSLGITQAQFNVILGQAKDHLQANTNWMSAAKVAAEDYVKDLQSQGMKMANVWMNAFKGMENALVSFITTGKVDFKGMVDSMIADLARLLVQQTMMKGISMAFGIPVGVGHSGGMVGGSGDVGRVVTPAVFAGARRFHTCGIPGLRSKEVPVIAKEGEAIFPTVRTSDGNFGVKAVLPPEMKGGRMINFAPTVQISVNGDGNPKDHEALAGQVSQATVKALEGLVKRVLGDELRQGGMLAGA